MPDRSQTRDARRRSVQTIVLQDEDQIVACRIALDNDMEIELDNPCIRGMVRSVRLAVRGSPPVWEVDLEPTE